MKKLHVNDVMYEQAFTHQGENGEQITIAIDRLVRHCRRTFHRKVLVPVSQEFAQYCVTNRGIEQHRLRKLSAQAMLEPLVFLVWSDGTHLLADGHHRYVWGASHGYDHVIGRIVKKSLWEHFVVEGVPVISESALRHGFSGIG